MTDIAELPIYDPGNAPEIVALALAKTEIEGSMVSFYVCVPRDVGGQRVRFVTGIINVPREAVPAMIAMTELAIAQEERGMMLVS